MFDDSDFEFDDDAVDAVFDKISSITSSNTIGKRLGDNETSNNDCVKKMRTESYRTKDCDNILNYFQSPHKNEDVALKNRIITNNASYSNKLHSLSNKPSTSKESNSFFSINVARKVVQRKFPGPAGILPEKTEIDFLAKEIEEDLLLKGTQSVDEPIICSQYSERIFDNLAWQRMVQDFSLDRISGQTLPEKYNIEWIKTRVKAQKLVNQKAPFLTAIVQSIECLMKSPGAAVTLKDKTGEIQGTIVYDLYEEYAADLVVGSVIILKQFGVLSTGISHVLTITAKNLVRIYSFPKMKSCVMSRTATNSNLNKEGATQEASTSFRSAENKLSELKNSEEIDDVEKIKIVNVQFIAIKDIIKDIEEIRNYSKCSDVSDDALDLFLDKFNKNFEEKRIHLEINRTIAPTTSTATTSNNSLVRSVPSISFNHSIISNRDDRSYKSPSNTFSPKNSGSCQNFPSTSNCASQKSSPGNFQNKKPRFQFKAVVNKENSNSIACKFDERILNPINTDKSVSKSFLTISCADKSSHTKQCDSSNILRPSSENMNKPCSQILVETGSLEEKKMVENIFEGLDADSFFEDF